MCGVCPIYAHVAPGWYQSERALVDLLMCGLCRPGMRDLTMWIPWIDEYTALGVSALSRCRLRRSSHGRRRNDRCCIIIACARRIINVSTMRMHDRRDDRYNACYCTTIFVRVAYKYFRTTRPLSFLNWRRKNLRSRAVLTSLAMLHHGAVVNTPHHPRAMYNYSTMIIPASAR